MTLRLTISSIRMMSADISYNQTSGGFQTTQRILFENALIVCQLLKPNLRGAAQCAAIRIISKSITFSRGDKLTSMQRVLNFKELKKIVDVVAVPQGQSFMDWLNMRKQEGDGSWKYVFRDYKEFPARKDAQVDGVLE